MIWINEKWAAFKAWCIRAKDWIKSQIIKG